MSRLLGPVRRIFRPRDASPDLSCYIYADGTSSRYPVVEDDDAPDFHHLPSPLNPSLAAELGDRP